MFCLNWGLMFWDAQNRRSCAHLNRPKLTRLLPGPEAEAKGTKARSARWVTVA